VSRCVWLCQARALAVLVPGDSPANTWCAVLLLLPCATQFEIDAESANGFKSLLIQARESHAEFKGEAAPLQTTHRSVRRTLSARSTPEALDVASSSSPLFQVTVAALLRLVRPLSFC